MALGQLLEWEQLVGADCIYLGSDRYRNHTLVMFTQMNTVTITVTADVTTTSIVTIIVSADIAQTFVSDLCIGLTLVYDRGASRQAELMQHQLLDLSSWNRSINTIPSPCQLTYSMC